MIITEYFLYRGLSNYRWSDDQEVIKINFVLNHIPPHRPFLPCPATPPPTLPSMIPYRRPSFLCIVNGG